VVIVYPSYLHLLATGQPQRVQIRGWIRDSVVACRRGSWGVQAVDVDSDMVVIYVTELSVVTVVSISMYTSWFDNLLLS